MVLLLLYSHSIPIYRVAKRKVDDKSFYGGVLHVCYAPEYETVEDVREKMRDRKRRVIRRLRELGNGSKKLN